MEYIKEESRRGQGTQPASAVKTRLQENPLVTAGIIPPNLPDVLLPPAKLEKHVMRIGKRKTTRARVLTSEDIAREIRKHEKAKKMQKKPNRRERKNEQRRCCLMRYRKCAGKKTARHPESKNDTREE